MRLTKIKNFDKILEIVKKHGGNIIGLFTRDEKLFARVVHYEGMVELEIGEGIMENDVYVSTYQVSALSKLFKNPEIEIGDSYVEIFEGNRNLKLAIMDVDIKPISYTESSVVRLNAMEIYTVFNELVTFSGKDQYAKNLFGIYYDADNKAFVATDGFRLVYYPFELDLRQSVLIPYNVVNDVIKLTKDNSNDVEILFNPNVVVFRTSESVIIHRLYDVNFPEYEKVLFKGYDVAHAKIERNIIQELIKFLSAIKSEKIRLEYSTNGLVITSTDEGIVLEDIFDLNFDKKFEPLFVNPKFMKEGFKVIEQLSDKPVDIHIKDGTSPLWIRNDDIEVVVMPIRG